ncbi:MAG: FtsQ-type POTRA domain-containing protein [Ignavibacteriae bacterium]|nr:FtsQ-type POTRA domain-containing protein [Ignavibacteriota bacterium]
MSKRKVILILLVLSFVIAGTVYFANIWRENMTYDKITVKGNITLTKDEILQAANIKSDSVNIEELNLVFIQDRISKHPEIKKVFVSKNPPNELVIDVYEKRPLAIVNVGNQLNLVDEECELFPFKNFEKLYDLPVITGIKQFSQQQIEDKSYMNDLKTAVFITINAYKKSKFLYNQISEINVSDTGRIVLFTNDKSVPVYFPRSENNNISDPVYQREITDKLVVLKNFFGKSYESLKDKKLDYVDLRYNNQVIVKTN